MTIQDIKNRLNKEHPNQYDDELIISWINDVERDIVMFLRLFEGIISEESEQHDSLTDEVMLNEIDVYTEYIICRICLSNEEYDRYNNHAAIFEQRLNEWKERYLRAHEPISRGSFKI